MQAALSSITYLIIFKKDSFKQKRSILQINLLKKNGQNLKKTTDCYIKNYDVISIAGGNMKYKNSNSTKIKIQSDIAISSTY